MIAEMAATGAQDSFHQCGEEIRIVSQFVSARVIRFETGYVAPEFRDLEIGAGNILRHAPSSNRVKTGDGSLTVRSVLSQSDVQQINNRSCAPVRFRNAIDKNIARAFTNLSRALERTSHRRHTIERTRNVARQSTWYFDSASGFTRQPASRFDRLPESGDGSGAAEFFSIFRSFRSPD